MTKKKPTLESDFKRFESFIDAMSDIEFEFWYKHEPTTSQRQRDLADGIREELDEDEADKLIEEHRDSLRNFYNRWI